MSNDARITGLQTYQICDQRITLHFSIDEDEHSITASFQCDTGPTLELLQEFHEKLQNHDWCFIGYDNKEYTACKCLINDQKFSSSTLTAIKAHYRRLLCLHREKQQYSSVFFSLSGIERIVELKPFCYDSSLRQITIPEPVEHNWDIDERVKLTIAVGHRLSFSLKELTVKQEPILIFSFKQRQNVNQIVTFLVRVRTYLELMFGSIGAVSLNNIVLEEGKTRAELLYDHKLSVYDQSCSISNPPSIEKEKLFNGLKGWILSYKKYEQAIKIWRKITANTNINENDKALWFAQALEAFVLKNKPLFEDSVECIPQNAKRRKEKEPNIEDILKCLDKKGCFSALGTELKKRLFSTVREYRNELVHTNPENSLTMGKILNSRKIIQYAFYQTVKIVMDFDWVPYPVLNIYHEDADGMCDKERFDELFGLPDEELTE